MIFNFVFLVSFSFFFFFLLFMFLSLIFLMSPMFLSLLFPLSLLFIYFFFQFFSFFPSPHFLPLQMCSDNGSLRYLQIQFLQLHPASQSICHENCNKLALEYLFNKLAWEFDKNKPHENQVENYPVININICYSKTISLFTFFFILY